MRNRKRIGTIAIAAALTLGTMGIGVQSGISAQRPNRAALNDADGDGYCDISGREIGSGNGAGRQAGMGNRKGPGDGSGNQGVGPGNGSGYGSQAGKGKGNRAGNGNCNRRNGRR